MVRTCVVLIPHLNRRDRCAAGGAARDGLVPGVCTLLASELWQDRCPSWGSFCPGGQGSAQTHSCDAAEKLFVARLCFHKHFDSPLPFTKIWADLLSFREAGHEGEVCVISWLLKV